MTSIPEKAIEAAFERIYSAGHKVSKPLLAVALAAALPFLLEAERGRWEAEFDRQARALSESDARLAELEAKLDEAIDQRIVWGNNYEGAKARLEDLEAKQLTPEEAKAAMSWLEKIEPAGVCDCSECRALAKIRARAEEAEGV